MPKSASKNLRIGYMPSFNMGLLSEIGFAKKHFDFIEITLKKDLEKYSKELLKKIKNKLGKFESLGHIHWELDLMNPRDFKKILKNIRIYNFLGAKKITIHPSTNEKLTEKEIKARNYKSIKEISVFCGEKNTQLLIENVTFPPFNNVRGLKYLLEKVPSLGMTLDIGHANGITGDDWTTYLKALSKEIKHIHLHFSYKENDHLPFFDAQVLYKILNQLKKLKRELTVTLEIFRTVKGRKYIPIDGQSRREILLKQLQIIRKADL